MDFVEHILRSHFNRTTPGRSLSKMNVRPRLNSLYQYLMVVIEGVLSLYTACNFSLISSHVFPFKNRNRITDRYSLFLHDCKQAQTRQLSIVIKTKLTGTAVRNFYLRRSKNGVTRWYTDF